MFIIHESTHITLLKSHQARTVESSRVCDTLVSSRMASPVKWKFGKEPYQLNFKQNWNNTHVICTIDNTKISSSSSHSSDDMWEKIEIALIFCKIFLTKYFLQYFQYSLDMPFLDSIHIPILKNRYHVHIYIYIYIYVYIYRKYKDYVYRKMLVQEYLKKWRIFKRVKPKNMMYHDIYNCICPKTQKNKIHNPLCQTYSPTVV